MGTYDALAAAYRDAVRASDRSAVPGEPEAQLTTPVSNLICALAEVADLGSIRLIRETRLDRTRPDFAVMQEKGGRLYQRGYIELKAPAVSVDATMWSGRNARQWEHMKAEAEILIVCNGRAAMLYKDGAPVGESAALPFSDGDWNARPLIGLLDRFLSETPTSVTSVADLSKRLALRTADLRDRLLWLLNSDGAAGEAAKGGHLSWRQHVHPDASPRDFADGASQVVAYGMVLAALSVAGADADGDGIISVAEARAAIRAVSPVLAAAFAPLVDKRVLFEAVAVEIGGLERLISAINVARINRSADRRGEPWLYFYEDFLSVYDPSERREAGVYYTPVDVVQAMVNIVDHLLVERFGKRLGFGDRSVVTLDPATGTGTFPLAVLDRAVLRAEAVRGAAGSAQAAANIANNLFAFELLPGPYSVAHLRITQRLHDLIPGYGASARVVLTDTLESPLDPQEQLTLFGDAEVLAAEQNRAKRIKLEQRVTVVLGNPPYRRVSRETQGRGSGGWVLSGKVPGRRSSKSLFDDLLDVARKNTIFSHHASLYNLYVYFWRWAIWKAFEAHGDVPGVVAFITSSSWLTGPGFIGLRQLARASCDEIWVLDLGGEAQGTTSEENVFAIETPVSIVVLCREGERRAKEPAKVRYRRVSGSAEQKLRAMSEIAASADPLSGTWGDASDAWHSTFAPVTGSAAWQDMPLLTDLFPWQQPGCKFGRTWPIAPLPDLLSERWKQLVAARPEARADLFATASTGRNVATSVNGMPRLVDLQAGAAHQPIVRYGYRSFDRQWVLQDPRLAALERPALWQSMSSRQIFLTSLLTGRIGKGPALTVSAYVPDLHVYRGSFGGKDIIPLFKDASGQPNITKGLGEVISRRCGVPPPSPEDLACYVYALLSTDAYFETFEEELKTPGLRVPLTADPSLWAEAVEAGAKLIWLHTFADRLQSPAAGRGRYVPDVTGLSWTKPVQTMPRTIADVDYDRASNCLRVGDGELSGVSPEVWEYSVSGMAVVRKWLSYRTLQPSGRAASSGSPLDQLRPEQWDDCWNDELLDLLKVLTLSIATEAERAQLLRRVCDGPLIAASDLPRPKDRERAPPESEAPLLRR